MLIIGAIVIIGLVVGGFYLYSNSQPTPTPTPNGENKHPYSEITYDDCVEDELSVLRNLPPASEEPIGAKRTDDDGNVWVKQEGGSWKTNAQGFENTGWGDALIDEQKGGANYTPEEFPECEKYMSTRNAKMEEEFNEIMNEVINEQSQKGVTFSVENIEVINLAGRLQGSIDLSCEKFEFETDESIIQSIANKLFLKYPNEFANGSERDSLVDVRGCSETGGSPDGINTYSRTTEWRISDGYYNFAI